MANVINMETLFDPVVITVPTAVWHSPERVTLTSVTLQIRKTIMIPTEINLWLCHWQHSHSRNQSAPTVYAAGLLTFGLLCYGSTVSSVKCWAVVYCGPFQYYFFQIQVDQMKWDCGLGMAHRPCLWVMP